MKVALITISILLISIVGLFSWNTRLKNERDQLYISTQKQLLDKDQSIEITKTQLAEYIDQNQKLDSTLKKNKIKQKDIKTITIIKEVYVGTSDTVTLYKDTIPDLYKFTYDKDCLYFEGVVDIKKTEVMINPPQYTDSITLISYLKKEKTGRKWLWVFNIKKKYLELHSYSQCGKSDIKQLTISD